jgi:hypothetical protein
MYNIFFPNCVITLTYNYNVKNITHVGKEVQKLTDFELSTIHLNHLQ